MPNSLANSCSHRSNTRFFYESRQVLRVVIAGYYFYCSRFVASGAWLLCDGSMTLSAFTKQQGFAIHIGNTSISATG